MVEFLNDTSSLLIASLFLSIVIFLFHSSHSLTSVSMQPNYHLEAWRNVTGIGHGYAWGAGRLFHDGEEAEFRASELLLASLWHNTTLLGADGDDYDPATSDSSEDADNEVGERRSSFSASASVCTGTDTDMSNTPSTTLPPVQYC